MAAWCSEPHQGLTGGKNAHQRGCTASRYRIYKCGTWCSTKRSTYRQQQPAWRDPRSHGGTPVLQRLTSAACAVQTHTRESSTLQCLQARLQRVHAGGVRRMWPPGSYGVWSASTGHCNRERRLVQCNTSCQKMSTLGFTTHTSLHRAQRWAGHSRGYGSTRSSTVLHEAVQQNTPPHTPHRPATRRVTPPCVGPPRPGTRSRLTHRPPPQPALCATVKTTMPVEICA